MIGNPIFGHTLSKKTKFKSYHDFLLKFRKHIDGQGSKYVLFGVTYIFVITIPYIFYFNENENFREKVLYLRGITVILCALLATRPIWPKIIRQYTPFIWYGVLCYCLPFLSFSICIINNGSLESMIFIFISILVLFLLVDWRSSLLIFLWEFYLLYFI